MSVTDGSMTTDGAAQSVRVVGTITTSPGGTQAVSGTVTANQGTAAVTANAWPTKLSNGTATVDVAPATASALGNALLVTTGQLTATTTLNAAAGNLTGTVMDAGAAKRVCTAVAVGTGTLTGTITILGSVDNTTFVSTGTTIALTAALTATASASNVAFRYFRADLTGAGGTGTVTVKLMTS